MAVTNTGQYAAVVKEGPNEKWFIVFEPLRDPEIPSLEGDLFGICLENGTTLDEARYLAKAIRGKMSSFFVTRFERQAELKCV